MKIEHLLTLSREADSAVDSAPLSEEDLASAKLSRFIEINQSLTALYIIIEVGRWENFQEKSLIRQAIGKKV